jgi:hypothetical protein
MTRQGAEARTSPAPSQCAILSELVADVRSDLSWHRQLGRSKASLTLGSGRTETHIGFVGSASGQRVFECVRARVYAVPNDEVGLHTQHRACKLVLVPVHVAGSDAMEIVRDHP